MAHPLMPKATAVWLIDNTTLTFDQIADFCGLHPLEVQAIADDEVAIGMAGLDPIVNHQLTRDEIARCEADSNARLRLYQPEGRPQPSQRTKGPRYTPVSKRGDKPNGILWIVKHYPEVTDPQIMRLIGTTKPTIQAIRNRTHWNWTNLRAADPVELGLCKTEELEEVLQQHGRSLFEEQAQAEHSREETPTAKNLFADINFGN